MGHLWSLPTGERLLLNGVGRTFKWLQLIALLWLSTSPVVGYIRISCICTYGTWAILNLFGCVTKASFNIVLNLFNLHFPATHTISSNPFTPFADAEFIM